MIRTIFKSQTGSTAPETERENQTRLAEKMAALELLAGGMAHDFSNRLQIIKGYSTMLADSANEEQRGHLDQIQEAAARGSELTQSLLVFGQRQFLQKEEFDLNDWIPDQIKTIRQNISEPVEIVFSPCFQPCRVRVDKEKLKQALVHLCSNSQAALPQGGQIQISLENNFLDEVYCRKYVKAKPGQYICLSVRDNGMGMSKETLARIFEPFFTTKPKKKNGGLGLSLVYGIVKQHHGLIEVETEPERGTTVKIYLPIASAEDRPPVPKQFGKPSAKKQKSVLIADDEAGIRSIATAFLHKGGYRIFIATNGIEACEIFERNPQVIDLLFFDLFMPEMGGRDAYEYIQRLKPGIPVLFSSGYSDEDLPDERGLRQFPYLQKPYMAEQLLGKIGELLKPE